MAMFYGMGGSMESESSTPVIISPEGSIYLSTKTERSLRGAKSPAVPLLHFDFNDPILVMDRTDSEHGSRDRSPINSHSLRSRRRILRLARCNKATQTHQSESDSDFDCYPQDISENNNSMPQQTSSVQNLKKDFRLIKWRTDNRKSRYTKLAVNIVLLYIFVFLFSFLLWLVEVTENKNKGKPEDYGYPSALLLVTSIITTVGYGDKPPTSSQGQLLCCLIVMIGVPLFLSVSTLVVNFIMSVMRGRYSIMVISLANFLHRYSRRRSSQATSSLHLNHMETFEIKMNSKYDSERSDSSRLSGQSCTAITKKKSANSALVTIFEPDNTS
ncbi:hypothetical protein Ciccas_012090 [Cichlidogyrus casuarinus]|uniref:Potassium channel domain-containing protein n=1 Tax=Cichlidogyrus casuarinus TaxID=1844966 RepID=A0ABD2PQS4_9PLAT